MTSLPDVNTNQSPKYCSAERSAVSLDGGRAFSSYSNAAITLWDLFKPGLLFLVVLCGANGFKFKLINGNCVIYLEVLEVQVFSGLGNAFFEEKAVALGSITARTSAPPGEVMHQCAAERRGAMPMGNTQEGCGSIRSPL